MAQQIAEARARWIAFMRLAGRAGYGTPEWQDAMDAAQYEENRMALLEAGVSVKGYTC